MFLASAPTDHNMRPGLHPVIVRGLFGGVWVGIARPAVAAQHVDELTLDVEPAPSPGRADGAELQTRVSQAMLRFFVAGIESRGTVSDALRRTEIVRRTEMRKPAWLLVF
jgi:hypothetical protein